MQLFTAEPGFDQQEVLDLVFSLGLEYSAVLGKLSPAEEYMLQLALRQWLFHEKAASYNVEGDTKINAGNLGVSLCQIMIAMHTKQAVHLCQVVYYVIAPF